MSISERFAAVLILFLPLAFSQQKHEDTHAKPDRPVLQGDVDRAERYLVRALDEARKGFGAEDGHVAAACNNLAELYRNMGNLEKAEPLYKEVCPSPAFSCRPPWTNQQVPDKANSKFMRKGMTDAGCKAFNASASLCYLNVCISKATLAVASGRNDVGMEHSQPAKHVLSRQCVGQALQILEAAYGQKDPRYATALQHVAGFYRQQQRFGAARQHFQLSLKVTLPCLVLCM